MFCEKFTDENPGVKPPSEHTYRQIFCNEFNLSFLVPKKDQCMTCTKFANLTGDVSICAAKLYHIIEGRGQN